MNWSDVQTYLRSQQINAWLCYDFRGSNPVLSAAIPGTFWTTRRVMLVVPATGQPRLIVHNIDASQFAACGVELVIYTTRHDWAAHLKQAVAGAGRVAMEYSPLGELPAASFADAGTVELVRSFGVEVVSSEDAVQVGVATWSADALREHRRAAAITAQVKDEAFALIRDRLAADQPVNERDVEQLILRRFADEGLDPDHPPIVGCNAHSGDPHFSVSPTNPAPIRKGDWILIDLWARVPGNANVFADITWMGYCGASVPAPQQRLWDAVKAARDAALHRVIAAWRNQQPIQGWQLDTAAQEQIAARGLTDAIRHRTGHSLSPGPKVHGLGANLDDFETHDTRRILPGTGFTIEPALYVADGGVDGAGFGCRTEINIYVDPVEGPVLTSPLQDEPLRLA